MELDDSSLKQTDAKVIDWTSQLEAVNKVLGETIWKVQHVEKLLAIKGVGSITIAGFIAEVGDIRCFKSPKQIQKYADTIMLYLILDIITVCVISKMERWRKYYERFFSNIL